MNAIVAVDKNWGIGKKNDLLFSLPLDMKYFREHTLDKVVVMGSNTLQSFPHSRPLPKRTNIVLFPGGDKREDCTVVESLDELFKAIADHPKDDVFVIGGAMLYRTLLNYCEKIYVTKVNADGNAEVFFENLDTLEPFELISQEPYVIDNGYEISFCVYRNNNVQAWTKESI